MISIRERVVSDLYKNSELSCVGITAFIFDNLISDVRFDRLLFLLFPDMTMEERKVIPAWKIIITLCGIDICIFLDMHTDGLIDLIKENITNGNININRNLLGFGDSKMYTATTIVVSVQLVEKWNRLKLYN